MKMPAKVRYLRHGFGLAALDLSDVSFPTINPPTVIKYVMSRSYVFHALSWFG